MSARAADHAFHRPLPSSLAPGELQELNDFLGLQAASSGLLSVDALHGFLTSIILLPAEIPAERWQPYVWSDCADDAGCFADPGQQSRLNAYVQRMYDDIMDVLCDRQRLFSPLLMTGPRPGEVTDGSLWCGGFLLGMARLNTHWRAFLANPAGRCLILPIFLLGADAVPAKWRSLAAGARQRASLTSWIPAAVEAIGAQLFLMELTAMVQGGEHAPSGADVFATAPCCCGSDLAFRECCGAPHRLH